MKKKVSSFSYILVIFMALFYMAFAVLVIFSPFFESTFSLTLRIITGTVFFLYAIFRVYRILKK